MTLSEREAAKVMDLRGQKATLAIALVAFVAFLILPWAGGVPGWQALIGAGTVRISIIESVTMWLATVGLGVLTTITLLTRRAATGLVAWMMVTVSFFSNLWGFWFRGSTADAAGPGMWLLLLGTGLAFIAYSLVALRRSPEQLEAARRARAEATQMDDIAKAQAAAATEANPLLVDDRRKRAAERHR